MEENLIGYVLKALDPPAQREVEEYLRAHPEAQARLELIRRSLTPLAEDKASSDTPPTGLRFATLGRVAEYRCRDLPQPPMPPPSQATIPIRPWIRWPDALVAAAILLVALPLIPLLRYKILDHANVTGCMNNLAGYHRALIAYADHHAGYLPQVKDAPPENVAGIFVARLSDERVLARELSIACPSKGHQPPPRQTLPELRTLYEQDPGAFDQQARFMGGCYAYVLGYWDETGRLQGLCLRTDSEHFPVMADRPPFDQNNQTGLETSNSANHGGRGQNVLFLGGHVTFATTRYVGLDRDDIYLNRRGQLNAGINAKDTVLGSSPVRVFPVNLPAE